MYIFVFIDRVFSEYRQSFQEFHHRKKVEKNWPSLCEKQEGSSDTVFVHVVQKTAELGPSRMWLKDPSLLRYESSVGVLRHLFFIKKKLFLFAPVSFCFSLYLSPVQVVQSAYKCQSNEEVYAGKLLTPFSSCWQEVRPGIASNMVSWEFLLRVCSLACAWEIGHGRVPNKNISDCIFLGSFCSCCLPEMVRNNPVQVFILMILYPFSNANVILYLERC